MPLERGILLNICVIGLRQNIKVNLFGLYSPKLASFLAVLNILWLSDTNSGYCVMKESISVRNAEYSL